VSENCHARWLREMATLLRAEKRTALANTAEQAAVEIEALAAHRDNLLDQFASLPRSRVCAELHYALDEWKNAGAPTTDVVNAVVNLVQHGLDASSETAEGNKK